MDFGRSVFGQGSRLGLMTLLRLQLDTDGKNYKSPPRITLQNAKDAKRPPIAASKTSIIPNPNKE
jgi:hypothetical protein